MNPCYSGFQVQGTATAPTGMTPSDTRNAAFYSQYNYIKYFLKIQVATQKFLKIFLRGNKAAAHIQDFARDKARLLGAKEKRGTRNLQG